MTRNKERLLWVLPPILTLAIAVKIVAFPDLGHSAEPPFVNFAPRGPTASISLPHGEEHDVWNMLACFAHWDKEACEAFLRRLDAEGAVEICLIVEKRMDCLPIHIDLEGGW